LSEVVDALIRCIEDEEIKGREILEVLSGKTRILPLGGPMPSGAGLGPAVEGFENACKNLGIQCSLNVVAQPSITQSPKPISSQMPLAFVS
jgi:hypothetical protein